MNDKETNQADDYRSYLLLDEISKNNDITQRDLSKRLGVALGLINSYIKNLASKGYITVSTIPKNRYKYYLTPKGFIEKTRLTYHHLQNFTSLYKNARQDFQRLFSSLKKEDVKKVAFCGSDEVAEIAYISLQEFGIKLTAVTDAGNWGKPFFTLSIKPINDLSVIEYERVIITSFLNEQELYAELLKAGVPSEKILLRDTTGKVLENGEDAGEARLRDFFRKREHIILAYLFGSIARRSETKESDYDIAVMTDSAIDRYVLMHELSLLLETDRIDLIILNDAFLELKYRIIKEGRILFTKDIKTKVEFEADTLSRYFDYLPVLMEQRKEILGEADYESGVERYRKAIGKTQRLLAQIRTS